MAKKRKLNSKNPKYWSAELKKEKPIKKKILFCEPKGIKIHPFSKKRVPNCVKRKKTREEYVSKYVHPDTNKVIDKYERRAKNRIKNRAKMGYHIGFPMGYPFRVK